MPLYNNKQPVYLDFNKNFSARNSGENVIYSKGYLFSNSGVNSLNTGSKETLQDSHLAIQIDSKNLYATGSKVFGVNDYEKAFEEKNNHLLFLKSVKKNPFKSNLFGDLVILKEENESVQFHCLLSRISGQGFYFSISSGDINGKSFIEPDHLVFSLKIPDSSKDKLIFYAESTLSEGEAGDFQINQSQSFSFRDQTSFPKNDGQWEIPSNYTVKTPICFVDLERESVVPFFNKNIVLSESASSYGINGQGYPFIS
jgi:hypothetical protein